MNSQSLLKEEDFNSFFQKKKMFSTPGLANCSQMSTQIGCQEDCSQPVGGMMQGSSTRRKMGEGC